MSVSDDEMAAALIAIRCYLEQDVPIAQEQDAPPRDPWHSAALMEGHGLAAARNGALSSWSSADRAGREARWSPGILGG